MCFKRCERYEIDESLHVDESSVETVPVEDNNDRISRFVVPELVAAPATAADVAVADG